ncbi:MAG: PTS system mannose/fructose/sorbose family transporter subunit IID [Calditrichia bacterium]
MHKTEHTTNSSNKDIRITRWDLFSVFLRSFFIQSVWNYRSLISIGFGVSLIPVIKKLYHDPADQRACLERHLEFFNSHPYMASYALGISAHLEEASANGDETAGSKLERLKGVLVGTLGAIGDNLFWFRIKPFTLILGVALLTLVSEPNSILLVLIASFLIYNVPHVYLRWKGLVDGYERGPEIVSDFPVEVFKRVGAVYRSIGVVGFILFLVVLMRTMGLEHTGNAIVLPVLTLGSILAHVYIRNFYLTVSIVLMLAIAAGYVNLTL